MKSASSSLVPAAVPSASHRAFWPVESLAMNQTLLPTVVICVGVKPPWPAVAAPEMPVIS